VHSDRLKRVSIIVTLLLLYFFFLLGLKNYSIVEREFSHNDAVV